MSMVRVIPRLDIKGPNLIKGIQFEGNRVLGAAQAFAEIYYRAGADELIYQDVVASLYQRNGLLEIIRKTAESIFIPLTVAGGIRTIEHIRETLRAGADKVAINTAAVQNPKLISQGAREFGSQCIVSSIEAYFYEGRYQVWVDYGREVTKLDATEWARQVVDLGAGEILLTSINREGTGRGYDLELIHKISHLVPVPVIACGGAGDAHDLTRAVREGGADAVAAASIFHYHYAQPVESPTMTFREPRLRMGENIDSGNIEFLTKGYGADHSICVTPTSIAEAKAELQRHSITTRTVVQDEVAHG